MVMSTIFRRLGIHGWQEADKDLLPYDRARFGGIARQSNGPLPP